MAKPDTKLAIDLRDGVYHLIGNLDERADLSPLLQSGEPLTADLREIWDINSPGTRRWLEFLKVWGNRELRLKGCPPTFVSLVNAMPPMLGATEDRNVIQTVLLPISCPTCRSYQETEIAVRNLIVRKGSVELPKVKCGDCGQEAHVATDPSDYFLFLLW